MANTKLFDIEADNIERADITKVHCIVVEDWETGKVWSCTDHKKSAPSMDKGLSLLAEADNIVAHNGSRYDVPVLKMMFSGWRPRGRIMDTLVMSRALFPHRKEADYDLARKRSFPKHMIGKHSLESWGYRLGQHKIEFEGPWDEWSQKMQTYCEGDVALLRLIFQRFIRYHRYCKQAVEVEHALSYRLWQGKVAGIPFDRRGAEELFAQLSEEKEMIGRRLRAAYPDWLAPAHESSVSSRRRLRWIKTHTREEAIERMREHPKAFFIPKRPNKARGYYADAPMTKLKLVEFNPGSRDHIARVLKVHHDWTPEKFTDKGKPEISEQSLKGLNFPHIGDFQQMLLVIKRIGQLANGSKAWLKQLDQFDVMHPTIHHNATVTHRGAHASPNITQVPKVTNPYGPQCRALFKVPTPDWWMLGADASGLELRVLAHYLYPYDGGQYVEWVLNGDVHEEHRRIMGNVLIRDDQKTWFYAYLYGAGDEKLGRIEKPGASEEEAKAIGKSRRKLFESRLGALGRLQAKLKEKAQEGWLRLIDGRHAMVRSEHSVLNTLLQGTGSLITKYWMVDFYNFMEQTYGTPVGENMVGNISPSIWHEYGSWSLALWAHDEIQTYIYKPRVDAELVQQQAVKHIENQVDRFKFRCPLTGEAKLGLNWADTH